MARAKKAVHDPAVFEQISKIEATLSTVEEALEVLQAILNEHLSRPGKGSGASVFVAGGDIGGPGDGCCGRLETVGEELADAVQAIPDEIDREW